jgi:cysteine desulfurase
MNNDAAAVAGCPAPFGDGPIYLDYNATTPVDPRVVEAMRPFLAEHFGNPSSSHAYGIAPRTALATARAEVADLVAADPGEIVFTGSGSEADTLAVRGVVLAALADEPTRWARNRPHVVTQVTEHPAVLRACEALQRLHGIDVTYLPVDTHGLVDPAALADAMSDRTVLVTVMHANNETGAVQPIADLAEVAHGCGAPLHTDAAQSIGKIPVDVGVLGADLLTVVGHKMYAPKGVAALYVRDGIGLEPLVPGGGQERGLRAGTENVALAVALGTAADLAADALAAGEGDRLRDLRDALHELLERHLPGRVRLNGPHHTRLPNTLNVSIDGTSGDTLLSRTALVAASTGSACHSGQTNPSPVLTAMQLETTRALAAVRLSLGRWTTHDSITEAAEAVSAAAVASRRDDRTHAR